MFILTTNDGNAYHNPSGMPVIHRSFEELRRDATEGPFPLYDWYALEVSEDEARYVFTQAYMAHLGRRDAPPLMVELL